MTDPIDFEEIYKEHNIDACSCDEAEALKDLVTVFRDYSLELQDFIMDMSPIIDGTIYEIRLKKLLADQLNEETIQ